MMKGIRLCMFLMAVLIHALISGWLHSLMPGTPLPLAWLHFIGMGVSLLFAWSLIAAPLLIGSAPRRSKLGQRLSDKVTAQTLQCPVPDSNNPANHLPECTHLRDRRTDGYQQERGKATTRHTAGAQATMPKPPLK